MDILWTVRHENRCTHKEPHSVTQSLEAREYKKKTHLGCKSKSPKQWLRTKVLSTCVTASLLFYTGRQYFSWSSPHYHGLACWWREGSRKGLKHFKHAQRSTGKICPFVLLFIIDFFFFMVTYCCLFWKGRACLSPGIDFDPQIILHRQRLNSQTTV